METQAQVTSYNQNEASESTALLSDIPDNVTPCLDPVFTVLTQSDPLTNSSCKEIAIMIDKTTSAFSRDVGEETVAATESKPRFETHEMHIQVPISESDSSTADSDKQVENFVVMQKNEIASEMSDLLSCPRMKHVLTKEDSNDKVEPSTTVYDYKCEDFLESEPDDKFKSISEDCDIAVPDVDNMCFSNKDASEMTLTKHESKAVESRVPCDLLVVENKMCISEDTQMKDTVIPTDQNDEDDSQSKISSLEDFPKTDADKSKLSTIPQSLAFMSRPTVEYPEDLNILSKSFTSENIDLNQDSIPVEADLELGNDQSPSQAECSRSCDEDHSLYVLMPFSDSDNTILSTVVPNKHDGQKKLNLDATIKNHKEDDFPDVFEKNDKPEDSVSFQDLDVPVSVTVDKMDFIHALSKAAAEAPIFSGLEELLPKTTERTISDDEPKVSLQYSEDLRTAMEDFETRISIDSDKALSPLANDYCIPPCYDDVSTTFDDNAVQMKAASQKFELSDTEAFFDCKQGASDFSEPEFEELEQQPRPYLKKQLNFEDYKDSLLTNEPLNNVREENEDSSSDEEFTLCEAPPKVTFCETGLRDSNDDDEDANESMSREIAAELGTLSESSDDEFLTTRIIRRRVFIKAEEMDDFPPQTMSEETYTDENGHTVVKKVTRRVIRKCASSSDGAVLEEVSSGEGAYSSIKTPKGEGYTKVKRNVVKSEGDESEVTFTECESFLKQTKAESGRAGPVEAEQTLTQHGDVSLASDLPSAQDDVKQALSHISVHHTELPHVVKRETVKDSGTLAERTQKRKRRSMRRTVVKGPVLQKQMLLERMEGSRIGSTSSDLKQHLHQLFHHHYEQNHGEDNENP